MARSKKSSTPEPDESLRGLREDAPEDEELELELEDQFDAEDIDEFSVEGDLDDQLEDEDLEEVVDDIEEDEEVDTEGEPDEEEADYDEEREPTLDEILKEKSGLADAEDEEEELEEEEEDEEEEGDSLTRKVLLGEKGEVGEGEFVCKSCFLVKQRTQLADPRRKLCRDCV